MLTRKPPAPKRRPISLALQGGGSHGAFQWGVLDRLLEDDRLDIRAVEIDGEPYWDGGYLANPALWPLFHADTPADILRLPLNRFVREEAPRVAGDIMDRLNEIVFNAPLVAELRGVALIQDMIEDGRMKPTGGDLHRRLMLHAIEPGPWLGALSLSSKFNTNGPSSTT